MGCACSKNKTLSAHHNEPKVSYVSFFGDVHTFSEKRMDENIFRGICHFED